MTVIAVPLGAMLAFVMMDRYNRVFLRTLRALCDMTAPNELSSISSPTIKGFGIPMFP